MAEPTQPTLVPQKPLTPYKAKFMVFQDKGKAQEVRLEAVDHHVLEPAKRA